MRTNGTVARCSGSWCRPRPVRAACCAAVGTVHHLEPRRMPVSTEGLMRLRTASLRHLVPVVVVVTILLLTSMPSAAQVPPPSVDAAARAAIVDEIVSALEEAYIFLETAEAMGAHVRERLAAGAYDDAGDLVAFTDRLTRDLQEVSKDLHLRVSWDPRRPEDGAGGPSDEERRAMQLEQMRSQNFCFDRLERMAGNVGYLKLDCFAPAEVAGPTAIAAMNFLANSDALIIDLRANGGGSPSMIQLLTSYLLEEPTHLNSFYVRQSDSTQQFWTQAWVQGPKLSDVPVWVLTSGRTFSAAEEFSYNLRNLERANLVGETTGGGAHPVQGYRLDEHPVSVSLPYGRAINPISGTNWEGTGVEPHVAVPAGEALATAHRQALERLAAEEGDPQRRARLEFAVQTVELRQRAPVALSPSQLDQYVGTFGPRRITRDGADLVYQRGEGARVVLVPAGDDVFLFGADDQFRIRFERVAGGEVARLVGLYADGREEAHSRE
ncbi:MAG: hypothetical protein DWQ36_19975 [Acidobacteria bacterium]|nr:MAG: hypothetical protein DWQ36_19975 [Acidobacteriota bacterium]